LNEPVFKRNPLNPSENNNLLYFETLCQRNICEVIFAQRQFMRAF
jgi:hypothetical protein